MVKSPCHLPSQRRVQEYTRTMKVKSGHRVLGEIRGVVIYVDSKNTQRLTVEILSYKRKDFTLTEILDLRSQVLVSWDCHLRRFQ